MGIGSRPLAHQSKEKDLDKSFDGTGLPRFEALLG